MLLKIRHSTQYSYDQPVPYGLQQARLTPKACASQSILDWRVDIEGGREEVAFDDQHGNRVQLISLDEDAQQISIVCSGEVETHPTAGVVGPHTGFAPLWYYKRQTPLTHPGKLIRKLAADLADNNDSIARLHGLSATIREEMTYETDRTDSGTTAEDALKSGHGVCQDHAHTFVSVARILGFPARYVSGYLMMNDRILQEASHAWAEAFVPDVGWIGFDVSNVISPDERYVRIAIGLDYDEAAPVSGVVFGDGAESLLVSLQVQQ
ncbi:transglutaminase family protein [Hyphomonas johnsonii]|uniref:Transglutaminase family protein n=1 Tax=Hyphomonas johnsonii MHS-2 TaxID=1280950 RepID=A0A059FRP7_9PROT|nr:transglutaminase family protein [Hyphomonas johnsonii]KCZ93186.1 transglutaminase family protein [Hyphomonas johnsonii MHS-2]